MTLYIDGDAFPNLLKPIILRAIERLNINTFVIANKKISIGKSSFITALVVNQGADEADDKIVELLKENDLVIRMLMQLTIGVSFIQKIILNNI